ncbi:unnamed protein product [Polarella glacialis]|uniref:Apple domain-containing protein n=1 Tax=Polarella glacialis TaxID=89957 RepID=A0A813JG79_POLGL|nr:unnamed protein product [Polarella glacialis]
MIRGGADEHLANISYTYSGFSKCTPPWVPAGCGDFARFEVRKLIFNWSSWVESKYKTSDEAWADMCDTAMKGVQPLSPGPVPFYMFGEVWSRWPLANLVHPGWREAFRFIDSLGGTPPNGYVEPGEFKVAYGLASTFLSTFTWCESLREKYSTAPSAWTALAGPDKFHWDFAKWTKVWGSFIPEDGFAKASADQAFVYADANGDEEVSEKEFHSIYFSCAPDSQRPGAAPGGASSRAEVDELLPGSPGSEYATKVPSEPVEPADPESAMAPKCLYDGVEYDRPTIGGEQFQEGNVTGCQARCRRTPGCGHFSFWRSAGSCKLFRADAQWRRADGSISGASRCIVSVQLIVKGLEFAMLSMAQQRMLGGNFGHELATAAGVPAEDVQDPHGRAASVGLGSPPGPPGAGCLVIESYVALPPGHELADVSEPISDGKLRMKLLQSLAQVDAGNALQPGISIADLQVTYAVKAVPAFECYMVGTKFSPNIVAKEPYASNASQCQAICSQTSDCHDFTYYKATGVCTLQGELSTPSMEEGAVGGPRRCGQTPYAAEPSKEELQPFVGGFGDLVWVWVLLALVLLAVMLATATCILRRSGFSSPLQGWCSSRQVSRKPDKPVHATHRYMPLSAEHHQHHQHSEDPKTVEHGLRQTLAPASAARFDQPRPSVPRLGTAEAWSSLGAAGNASNLQRPVEQTEHPSWMPRFLGPEDARLAPQNQSLFVISV